MSRSLKTKVIVNFLVLAVLVVGLTAGITNRFISRQFEAYVRDTHKLRHERLVAVLEKAYAEFGDWHAFGLTGRHFAPVSGFPFMVLDENGRPVIYSPARGMMYRRSGRALPPDVFGTGEGDDYTIITYPLEVNGRCIGTLLAGYPARIGIWNELDQRFRRSILISALLAGGVAVLIGLGAGVLLAGNLVGPVKELTRAAGAFARGDLGTRVTIHSDDEVGELAHGFNDMAEQLQKLEGTRRRLTADMAHELRTPLTIAQNLIEAFADGVLPADDENLGVLKQKIQELTQLVDDLRELSVAESGRLHLHMQRLDVREIVNEVVETWRDRFAGKGIKLQTEFDQRPVIVNGDEGALSRVLNNLISNAQKYTPANGSVQVVVKNDDGQAVVRVDDTGPGIPVQEQSLVFERFYRGKNAVQESTDGTGVGLAIVRELVRMHNGSISLTSVPGKGSSFSVHLPLSMLPEER